MIEFIKDYLLKDNHYINLFGIIIILFISFLLCKNKKNISIRLIISSLALQFLLASFVLKINWGNKVFVYISNKFLLLNSFADAGIKFLFGNLADAKGPWGIIFAIKVLPIIIFFGALMAILFHLGVIQFIVKIISFCISPLLGTSGAETLVASARCMVDPTAAPLLIKKYIKDLTESEMFVVMVAGFSNLTAAIIAVYGSMGVPMIHLITSSILSIFGSILIAKLFIPETQEPKTLHSRNIDFSKDSKNIFDAIATGTSDGLGLALNVGAMLIAFISLIYMFDYILIHTIRYSLNDIFSSLFYYVAALIGIESKDRSVASVLLGQKLVLNEFVAYVGFVKAELSARSQIILTYALAGFANFSVIGMLIGGIGALAPERRALIAKLGLKALLAGTLVNLLNACIAALLI